MAEKVDLAEKFRSFDEPWVPKIVAELNGQYVKVAKLEGAYVWHAHENEDEMFLVVEGRVTIELRDGDGDGRVDLGPGQLYVVPRGVEHRPVAHCVASVVLFEPATTRNTGNVDHDYTIEVSDLERI